MRHLFWPMSVTASFCFTQRITAVQRVCTSRGERGRGRYLFHVKLNLADPCRTIPCQYHLWELLAGRLGQLFQYMRKCNAESPKQDSKRFNSQGRRRALSIWAWLIYAAVFFYLFSLRHCRFTSRVKIKLLSKIFRRCFNAGTPACLVQLPPTLPDSQPPTPLLTVNLPPANSYS